MRSAIGVWLAACVLVVQAGCKQESEHSGEGSKSPGRTVAGARAGGEGLRHQGNVQPALRHQVAKVDDISIGTTKRLSYRVVVAKDSSDADLRNIAKVIVAKASASQKLCAINVFFYHDPDTVDGAYTVGVVEWAPDGEWSKATDVRPGDYSRHRYVVRTGSALGVQPIEPS